MYGISVESKNSFLRKVYFQMFLGILVTSLVSVFSATSYSMMVLIDKLFYPIVIGEIILVIALNTAINKMSNMTAKLMFFLYSAMNGLILSYVMLVYDAFSVITILAVTSIIFIVMSIYGMKTKEDLSAYSGFFKGGLITLVIVSIINLFLGMSILGWIISVFGVVLFTALIAYDTQRIMSVFGESGLDEESLEKFSTIGALMLYLDFVNLFLKLLSLFGKKK